MTHKRHDIGIASQIGPYSDGVEVAANKRWLFTAGTPGLTPDGTLPADITGQAELAWQNIIKTLESASMGLGDLVKITQYLVRADDIPAYAKVRAGVLSDDFRPASMLMVVTELPRPGWLIEIEAYAAKS